MSVEQKGTDDTASGIDQDSQSAPSDSVFVSKFFKREDFASLILPYGTLRSNNDGSKVAVCNPLTEGNTDPKTWAAAVFEDCISYMSLDVAGNKTFEWYHDFIVFTNLQAAVYTDHELVKDGENLDLLLEFINKHMRNLRSSVAKNALFFVGCIIEATENDNTLFVSIALRLIPQLIKCSTSEKVVYRKPAIDNIVAICKRCRNKDTIAIAWTLMDHSHDRNPKICAAATIGLETYFEHFDHDMLVTLDLEEVTDHVEPCLGGRSAPIRRLCSTIVIKIADRLSTDLLDTWWSYVANKPHLAKLLKPYMPSPDPSEVASDNSTEEVIPVTSNTSTEEVIPVTSITATEEVIPVTSNTATDEVIPASSGEM